MSSATAIKMCIMKKLRRFLRIVVLILLGCLDTSSCRIAKLVNSGIDYLAIYLLCDLNRFLCLVPLVYYLKNKRFEKNFRRNRRFRQQGHGFRRNQMFRSVLSKKTISASAFFDCSSRRFALMYQPFWAATLPLDWRLIIRAEARSFSIS